MKIPFVMNGGKNTNLFTENQLDLNFKLKNLNLFKIVNKLTEDKEDEIMIKASETKKYYDNLNKK
jgi:hypothetical protein